MKTSPEEKQEMRNELALLVKVGVNYKLSTRELLSTFTDRFPIRQQCSINTNLKFVTRLAEDIQNSIHLGVGDGFEMVRNPGKTIELYWRDKESQDAYLDRFSMTKARALALYFVSEYLEDVLPSTFTDQLQLDFQSAKDKLISGGFELTEIIEYKPEGIELISKLTNDQDIHDEHINTALDAILRKKVLRINASSIHEGYGGTKFVSPHRLSYFDNKLKLLAYINKEDKFKHYSFNSIKELTISDEYHYQSKNPADYQERHWFIARCHKWVKKYFENVQFGQLMTFTHIEDDVWELKSQISFPYHFKAKKPDNFFIANFLSRFGDSIEVVEPLFLREEMKRRSLALASVYEENNSKLSCSIINKSPHEIADLAIYFGKNCKRE